MISPIATRIKTKSGGRNMRHSQALAQMISGSYNYRLRIGMRFTQQGHEFVIEGPLPDDQLKIKDTFTDVCSARTMADLLEDLFAGRLELIGAGNEGKVLRGVTAGHNLLQRARPRRV